MSVTVPIDFTARFDEAAKSAAKFANTLASRLSKIDLSTSFLAFDKVAERVGEGIHLIADGIGDVIDAASQMEETNNRLVASLQASGDFSEKNVQAFKDLAEQLSKTAKFDDDVILSQVSLAKQFDTTNKEAARLIEAAVELSAVTKEDLATSVTKLGQTLDGTLGSIGKNIPALKNLTEEQLRNNGAVDFLISKYKGFAEKELDTFRGGIVSVEKSFNNLEKAIGTNIIKSDAIKRVFFLLSDAFERAAEFVKANQVAIQDFIKNGIIALAKAIAFLAQVLSVVDQAFSIMVVGLRTIYELIKNVVLLVKNDAINIFKLLGAFLTGNFSKAAEYAGDIFSDLGKNLVESNEKINQSVQDIGSRQGIYNKISEEAANFAFNVETSNKYLVKTKEKVKAVKVEFDSLGDGSKRFNQQLKTDFESLSKSLENQGATALETLQKKFLKEQALIKMFRGNTFESQKNNDELLHKLRLKFIQEEAKIQQEKYDKLVARVQAVVANPFAINTPEGQVPSSGGALGIGEGTSVGIGRGIGIAGNILGGAEGAKKLLGLAASGIGVALLGPVGQALGPLVEQLSAGPEQVKKMVEQFADALPLLIENVIKAIPVVIQVLADKAPEIIQRLVDDAPEIITALIKQMPRLIQSLILLTPRWIAVFAKAGIKFAASVLSGAVKFVAEIIRGAGKFVSKILEGAGKGAGKILGIGSGNSSGGIGGLIKKVPIIGGLLGGGGFHFKGDQPVIARPRGPSTVTAITTIGNKALAKSVIDLKKLGYRLEPI